jgi:hypothetical protein
LPHKIQAEEKALAAKEITITPRDVDRLIDWIRRTGKPQTTKSLARRYLEMLREDKGIK